MDRGFHFIAVDVKRNLLGDRTRGIYINPHRYLKFRSSEPFAEWIRDDLHSSLRAVVASVSSNIGWTCLQTRIQVRCYNIHQRRRIHRASTSKCWWGHPTRYHMNQYGTPKMPTFKSQSTKTQNVGMFIFEIQVHLPGIELPNLE